MPESFNFPLFFKRYLIYFFFTNKKKRKSIKILLKKLIIYHKYNQYYTLYLWKKYLFSPINNVFLIKTS
jgi:hypothetical protein